MSLRLDTIILFWVVMPPLISGKFIYSRIIEILEWRITDGKMGTGGLNFCSASFVLLWKRKCSFFSISTDNNLKGTNNKFYRGACRNFKKWKSMIVDNNLDLILSFGSSLQLCVKCFNFSTPKPSWCVLKALHQLLERVWQIQNKNSGKSNLENALQRTDKLEACELTNWRRS